MASGSYIPRSPDLTGLPNPQPFTGYRPQSPNLSGLPPTYYDQQHPLPPAFTSPYHTAPYATPRYDMAPSRVKHEDPEYLPDAAAPPMPVPQQQEHYDPTLGVVLKTSFPVARIKRIMQADEDIGKVAQVTPHVVSRALELFMIKLITASTEQARSSAGGGASKGPRRVLMQHMKQAIQADDKFDFLAEIVSKVPDAPTKATSHKKDAGSDSEDAKPRKKSKRRRDDDD